MTYAELKTNIANYLNRSDLTSYIDTFIDSTEAELNRRLRTKDGIRRLVKETKLSVDDFVYPLFIEEGEMVKKGDVIDRATVLGVVWPGPKGISVHFEVWKVAGSERSPQDPKAWLYPR